MGFFDNLEEHQVKCFSYPYLNITKNTIDIGTECGAWNYFKRGMEVPYRTNHYDFGENFMIFDIRRTFWGKSFMGLVHVIENGRYIDSVHYLKLTDNHPIYLVIDQYGKPLKIKTKEDFKTIIEEEVQSAKKYEELRKMYLIQMAGIPLMTITTSSELRKLQKENGWSDEFLKEQIQKNDSARAMAYEDAIEPFLKKWYDIKLMNQIYSNSTIGVLYEVYLQKKNDYEWEKIIDKFRYAAEQENTTIETHVEQYLNWAKEHRIKIKSEFYELFPQKEDN